MINDVFKTLGLREEETKVYLLLLEYGPKTVGTLAKTTGVKRPTLYVYLERLVTNGLVSQSLQRGVKIFTPEPAKKIYQLYERKISDLKKQQKSLDNIIPELEKLSGMSLLRPKMHFFEGQDGMELALQDHLSYPGFKISAFWSIKAALELTSPDFFHYLNIERIQKNMYHEVIWPANQKVDVKKYPFLGVGSEFKREIRVAPKDIEASMGYWIYSNKVLFMSSRAESYSFIIESSELVEMMLAQHRGIWGMSKPITPSKEDMKPFLDDLSTYIH